jgi:hypothetical protein
MIPAGYDLIYQNINALISKTNQETKIMDNTNYKLINVITCKLKPS